MFFNSWMLLSVSILFSILHIYQYRRFFFSSLILYFFGFSIKVICLYKWIEDNVLFYIPYKILKNIEIVYFLNKK